VLDENLIEKSFKNFYLPPAWNNFFQELFTNKKKLSDSKLRVAKSLFMDAYFCIKQNITPKHYALAQALHHLTRSKHLVSIMHRLGHCISYQSLKLHDQELFKKIIIENQTKKVPLPTNIIVDNSLFLHGAIDNNDFCEETLSGKGSTHVTAMVLYQEKPQDLSAHCHQAPMLREALK